MTRVVHEGDASLQRASATLDGLVERTFLFSDIEGSTPLWERWPRRMSTALVHHDALIDAAVSDNGGTIFKHTGDGVVAWFAQADAALRAAAAMQRAIVSADWPSELELRIRVGLHHGQAEARGNDFFGRTMNLAARVMSAAAANQILISAEVLHQVGDDHGLDLRPEGPCSLRGIRDPVELWSVFVDGVPTDVPRVAEPDPVPSTIPLVPDDLVGRDLELEEIARALDTHRTVTLTGPPGTGKTRLAVEAASRALSTHRGGVHVVELAAVRDASTVADVVASTVLGVEPIGDPAGGVERLAAAIERPALLVLDNCEHLIDEVADFVGHTLRASQSIRFLLTSREPLLEAAEHVIEVEPLATGEDGPATRLFLQRARAARGAGAPLDVDRVAEICDRLDGLPLAIELAAARLDVLTLDELDARLFDLLGASRRSRRRRDDRHATIDAAVRWSWNLLDEDERLVLARASVFAGTFDLDAASAVCGGDEFDAVAMIDLLGALQDRSFISSVWFESGNRFRLLEIVRSFAAAQLSRDELDIARRRHQDHFAALSSQLAVLFDRKPEPEVIEQLELDDANFNAALQHIEGGGIRTARKLAMQLHTYWEETGRLSDGFHHARRLLDPPDPRSGLWRGVLGLTVTYAAMVGRLNEVRDHERQLEELVAGPAEIGAINAYFALGFADLARARLREAAGWFEMAAEVIAPFDGNGQRQALMTAGSCLAYADDPEGALRRYREARSVPPPEQGWFAAYAEVFEASARIQLDPRADHDQRCVDMHSALVDLDQRGLGFRVTVAAHQAAIGFALAERDDLFDRWAPIIVQRARANGHRWAVGLAVELLGWSSAWRGDDESAVAHWSVAERVFAESGYGLPHVHAAIRTRVRALVDARLAPERAAAARSSVETVDLATHVGGL